MDTSYSTIWYFQRKGDLGIYNDNVANKDIKLMGTQENFSEFNSTFAKQIINFYTEIGFNVLDPFAGRTRASICAMSNRKYYGFEVSKKTYEYLNSKLNQKTLTEFKYKPEIFNKDSYNIDEVKIPTVDIVFTCPPYWDKEKYESCDGQLSDIKKYSDFLKRLKIIFEKSNAFLKTNGYFIVVVSDIRKDGILIPFHNDVMNIFNDIGLKLHDLIILQTVSFDVANKRFGGFKHKKLLSKVHEYCLVYKK